MFQGYPTLVPDINFIIRRGGMGPFKLICFSGIAHFLGCSKAAKNSGIALFSIKLGPKYDSVNSKVFFQQRACITFCDGSRIINCLNVSIFMFFLCRKHAFLHYFESGILYNIFYLFID